MIKSLRIVYYTVWFLTFMGHGPLREIYEAMDALHRNTKINIGKKFCT